MTFENLNIIEEILKALHSAGYTEPSPIQAQAIPLLLNGEDILGSAQTGSGKTAAFAIPILQNIVIKPRATEGIRKIKSLVLTPTRELALQIKDSFASYGRHCRLKTTVIYGGVNQNPQTKALMAGVDILVATPGRLLDLMNQKYVDLSHVESFVLDEADRMLDMGFINDVQKIVKYLPAQRQTMLFSATMPREIEKLASELLKNPKRVAVTPVEATVDIIDQYVYKVIKKDKLDLLVDLLAGDEIKRALIFTRTKHGANKLVTELGRINIAAQAIHGNKSQSAREQALRLFKKGELRVLVATDIAARGIDISELSHVINYELPEVAETYIHRIGRTGRAGHAGVALTFCNPEELGLLQAIERHIKTTIPVVENHNYVANFIQGSTKGPGAASKPRTGERKQATSNPRSRTRKPGSDNLQKDLQTTRKAKQEKKSDQGYQKPSEKRDSTKSYGPNKNAFNKRGTRNDVGSRFEKKEEEFAYSKFKKDRAPLSKDSKSTRGTVKNTRRDYAKKK